MKKFILAIIAFLSVTLTCEAEEFIFKISKDNPYGYALVKYVIFNPPSISFGGYIKWQDTGRMIEDITINEQVADSYINTNDYIVFKDSKGELICAIYSDKTGNQTSIMYPNEGELIEFKGNSKNPEFAKSYNMLYQYIGSLTASYTEDDLFFKLVKYPFGMEGYKINTIADLRQALDSEGWPSSPTGENAIYIISSSKFEIPYTLFEFPVSSMAAYFFDGKLYSHDLEVSRFNTEWTKEECVSYARLITTLLQKDGYSFTKEPTTNTDNNSHKYYKAVMKKGNQTAEIEARIASKYDVYDAHTISLSFRP